jgi:hypothetical protein
MQKAQQRYQAKQAAKVAKESNKAPSPPKPAARSPSRRRPGRFCQLPEKVIATLIEHEAGRTAWTMVALLQRLWFEHPNHYNPVCVTNSAATSVRLSKYQKWRALQELERIGLVTVYREKGKNPIVELEWRQRRLPL